MQDAPKEVWNIPYVSVEFFPGLNENLIAYRSSKVSSRPDCIFEIHQQWQSGFSRVYSNCCCRWSFEAEIIKIGQSSHTMYSNKILNVQESTTILDACTKKSTNLLKAPQNNMIYYICPILFYFILRFTNKFHTLNIVIIQQRFYMLSPGQNIWNHYP